MWKGDVKMCTCWVRTFSRLILSWLGVSALNSLICLHFCEPHKTAPY
jgi:hypothetical protein